MEEKQFVQNSLSDKELSRVNGGSCIEKCIIYTVRRGDTYAKIAVRYRTTVELLRALNNRRDEYPRTGETLWVPVTEDI